MVVKFEATLFLRHGLPASRPVLSETKHRTRAGSHKDGNVRKADYDGVGTVFKYCRSASIITPTMVKKNFQLPTMLKKQTPNS